MRAELRGPPPVDAELLAACAALLTLGLTALYSLSSVNQGSSGLFTRQVVFAVVGMALMAALRPVSLSWWRRRATVIFAVALGALALTLIAGVERNGARRWLGAGGLTLQPGEFAKLALMLFMAKYCARHAPFHTGAKLLAPLAPWLGALSLILLMQPDFGGLCLTVAVAAAILFLSGLRMVWGAGITAAAVGLGAALVVGKDYRMRRLTSFMDPGQDITGTGYNQWHSLMAFRRGDLFGEGLGRGVEKWGNLPAAHNDFIAAILAEEIGFAGFAAMVALFAFVVTRAAVIGRDAAARGEMFGALYAFGFAAAITAQVVVNLAGNLALGPVKGFTLPLVSYGGSSLLATAIMVAVLLRVDFENRRARRVS